MSAPQHRHISQCCLTENAFGQPQSAPSQEQTLGISFVLFMPGILAWRFFVDKQERPDIVPS
jgi:hypothetical protein